jgi:hypothetical protein
LRERIDELAQEVRRVDEAAAAVLEMLNQPVENLR